MIIDIKTGFVKSQTPNEYHVKDNCSLPIDKDKINNDEDGFQNFHLNEKGVWFCPEGGEEKNISPLWICSPLFVLAVTRDENNENHGRLLKLFDSDGKKHLWTLPMELLASDGAEYRRVLLSLGLKIAPGRKARDLLTHYIQTSEPKLKARCVAQTGWVDQAYVFPDESIGGNESIYFQSMVKQANSYQVKGSLDEWKQEIGKYCVDNSRLCFAVSATLAAPLLHLLDEENSGFHFRGPSSNGKTTVLKVAASVFGGKKMIHTWRATSNGLESIAAAHNDSLLCLDEMGQMNPKEVGETAYMLANGMGKLRANKNAYAREKHTWRLLFLSSGEISLADHMKEGGKKVRAGQEVRIIDIPSDTGEHGAFEYLYSMENGATFSRYLCQKTESYHGTLGRAFIKKLVEDISGSLEKIKKYREEFIEKNTSSIQSGQISRALHKFSLVAAAGRLATDYDLTGWTDEDAFWAAEECFKKWVENRGGTTSQEEISALKQVRHFFELHGESRFSNWDGDENQKTINRAGYKKMSSGFLNFFVFQEVFRSDICSGLSPNDVAKVLVDKGWIIPSSDGKSSRSEKLPGFDTSVRCYRFDGDKVFSDVI